MSIPQVIAFDAGDHSKFAAHEEDRSVPWLALRHSSERPLNKLLINQAYENMGLRATQLLGTLFDGMTRHTEEAYRWVEEFGEKGFRETIRDRDRPWGDYGERSNPK